MHGNVKPQFVEGISMKKLTCFCASLCAILLLLTASPVLAQNILWVANNGSDANVCSETAPCGTFQGAINKGNVTQINCLTSGNYGGATITASLTIDCGTGNIGTVASTAIAFFINTTSPIVLIVRHLNFNGLGSAGTGIGGFYRGLVIVENCMFQNFSTGYGIGLSANNGRGLLQVSNSQIINNGTGIAVYPQSGQIASVTLDHVQLIANTNNGLELGGSLGTAGEIAGTLRESIVGENGGDGVLANASQVFFTIEESSIIANLANGIHTASANALVNVGASTIGGNVTGVMATAGSLISFGNNQISVNANNGNFTSTIALK
jgi:hypothetical protein